MDIDLVKLTRPENENGVSKEGYRLENELEET